MSEGSGGRSPPAAAGGKSGVNIPPLDKGNYFDLGGGGVHETIQCTYDIQTSSCNLAVAIIIQNIESPCCIIQYTLLVFGVSKQYALLSPRNLDT